jgi:hypothetical protein
VAMDGSGAARGGSVTPERGPRGGGRRRRPSGEPPPLPRQLGVTGRIWMTLAVALLAVLGLILLFAGLADPFEQWESTWLRAVGSIRTGWLTTLLVGVNTVLASRWTVRILRLGTLVALVGLRRWRHLFTFLGSVIAVELVVYQLSLLLARPRPVGIKIIGSWAGFSMPSYPVAALAVTLAGWPMRCCRPAGRGRGGSGRRARRCCCLGFPGPIWLSIIRLTFWPR